MLNFKITNKKGKARIGVFKTPRGEIETPVFMPVGTFGAVKTLAPWELQYLDAKIILGNTYHLYLRPGDDLIVELGGLHQFMNWPKPILTDSGGFQVYSIGERQAIDEEGIRFRSHIDGSEQRFTPEKSIQIQKNLGADIIMAFDDVAGISCGRQELKIAMERTGRWLVRCITEKENRNQKIENSSRSSGVRCQVSGVQNQALFGIVQGGYEEDLRKKSAEFIASQNLPGNAIGGLAMPGDKIEIRSEKLEVSAELENRKKKIANSSKLFKEKMWQTVELVNQILPENKPRYLMGVGEPADLVKAINLGCDMFDCVLPTRLARHGSIWIKNPNSPNSPFSPNFYQRISLLNSRFKADPRPLDENCLCPACRGSLEKKIENRNQKIVQGFSRAYLRHLLVTGEVLGIRLLSMHNIWFINDLIRQIKEEINSKS